MIRWERPSETGAVAHRARMLGQLVKQPFGARSVTLAGAEQLAIEYTPPTVIYMTDAELGQYVIADQGCRA
jgi:hypothetical protein